MTKPLKNKIALITGASRGIGAAVAKRFAAEGAHVIVVARTISGLEEVDDEIKKAGGECTLVPLNLLEFEKIDELGGIIAKRFGKLDILVGNAAMLGVLAPIGHIDPKVWEKTIALNMTANYRLIRSFDALLRKADAGRAIFVSSDVANDDSPYWGAYAASKAGLEKIVKTYASETKKTNIRTNIIDPGEVGTRMMAEAMPGRDIASMAQPDDVTDLFLELALDSCNSNSEIFKCNR